MNQPKCQIWRKALRRHSYARHSIADGPEGSFGAFSFSAQDGASFPRNEALIGSENRNDD